MLGPLVQKITLAQRKMVEYTIYLLTTDLMNCTLRTAVTFLLLLSIFYFLISKNRQRMRIPTECGTYVRILMKWRGCVKGRPV